MNVTSRHRKVAQLFYNEICSKGSADRKLLDVHSNGVSHLLQEGDNMLSLGISVSGGLVLPRLDDGKGVSTDFLAEITGNVSRAFLKQNIINNTIIATSDSIIETEWSLS